MRLLAAVLARRAAPAARRMPDGDRAERGPADPRRGGRARAPRRHARRLHGLSDSAPRRHRGVGAVNVLVDVTERRKAEEALRAAAERSPPRTWSRTSSSGLVSHELRTPVTTIFGNAHLLRGRRGCSPRRSGLDADRHRRRVEPPPRHHREPSPPDPAGPGHHRAGAAADRARRPATPSTAIASTIPSAPSRSRSSPGRWWSRPIGVTSRCCSTTSWPTPPSTSPPPPRSRSGVSSDDQEACVSVLDRGIGIGDADPGQLFTAFYRTRGCQDADSRPGIGLAVCQRIVDSLGGRIWARPREGGGIEAGFALPLAVVSPD